MLESSHSIFFFLIITHACLTLHMYIKKKKKAKNQNKKPVRSGKRNGTVGKKEIDNIREK